MSDTISVTACRRQVKAWQRSFKAAHGRLPTAADVKSSRCPEDVKAMEKYNIKIDEKFHDLKKFLDFIKEKNESLNTDKFILISTAKDGRELFA